MPNANDWCSFIKWRPDSFWFKACDINIFARMFYKRTQLRLALELFCSLFFLHFLSLNWFYICLQFVQQVRRAPILHSTRALFLFCTFEPLETKRKYGEKTSSQESAYSYFSVQVLSLSSSTFHCVFRLLAYLRWFLCVHAKRWWQ